MWVPWGGLCSQGSWKQQELETLGPAQLRFCSVDPLQTLLCGLATPGTLRNGGLCDLIG